MWLLLSAHLRRFPYLFLPDALADTDELEYTNPWAEVLPGQGLEKGEFQPANGHHDHDEHDHDHGHGHGKAHH